MPLKTAGFEGHFVPEPVPKSKSQFSYVIGTRIYLGCIYPNSVVYY